ncbi:hypothetical protein PAXRUDRAFT_21540 [Paxillus rubicundulus Ve08.2h10]|uniref:Uncharacterized protein n=1 Tax=Paxillus rubicundulus Ve08.2h10 TaxID=930991 RepID=A0A0D0D7B1_9AGAM|nr:hypothetical protein PAXRUDRAFT_21540 [Paxillus rubicundulus Ve08.2h10]
MSSSTTSDLSKWSDEQLHENEDDDNELFEKKSAEGGRAADGEEAARRKAEEEAKRKAEVEAQRRAEVEVKACAEEVVRAQSLTSGPSKGKQPRVTASGTAEVAESMRAAGSSKARSCDHCRRLWNKCERPGDAQPSRRRKQEEVMSPRAGKKKVWTKSPTAEDDEEDAEEIRGCLDPEFLPEEGSEEDFEEGEVAEAAEEREALKGQNEEEEEVDESV